MTRQRALTGIDPSSPNSPPTRMGDSYEFMGGGSNSRRPAYGAVEEVNNPPEQTHSTLNTRRPSTCLAVTVRYLGTHTHSHLIRETSLVRSYVRASASSGDAADAGGNDAAPASTLSLSLTSMTEICTA